MDMNQIKNLVGEAVRDADLRPEEIPAIDLYVDQITSLTSDKLKEGSPRFHDRVLTKTMINNYSKDGLLSPIKGKKYSKEQFLQMLLVYSLKNTLSIGEIKHVLQNVYALPDCDEKWLEASYARFLDVKECQRQELGELVERFVKKHDLDVACDADFFVLLLGLSALSSYLKNTVQSLLEVRYPDVETAAREKKEETKRQQKEERKAAKSKKEAAEPLEGAEQA